LSGAYMRALFDDFAAAIKAQLPNAKISWDIRFESFLFYSNIY